MCYKLLIFLISLFFFINIFLKRKGKQIFLPNNLKKLRKYILHGQIFSRYESAAKELKNVLKVMVSSDSEKMDSPREDLSKMDVIMPKKITGILSKQSPFPQPDSNIPTLKVHFVVTEVRSD